MAEKQQHQELQAHLSGLLAPRIPPPGLLYIAQVCFLLSCDVLNVVMTNGGQCLPTVSAKPAGHLPHKGSSEKCCCSLQICMHASPDVGWQLTLAVHHQDVGLHVDLCQHGCKIQAQCLACGVNMLRKVKTDTCSQVASAGPDLRRCSARAHVKAAVMAMKPWSTYGSSLRFDATHNLYLCLT